MNKEKQILPELRFPAFEKDDEWIKESLGKIGKPLMCKRIFKEQTSTSSINAIPFYKIGTFGREPDAYIPVDLYNKFKSKFSFPNIGDILISASGTIGRLVVYDGSDAYFQDSNIVWIGNDETQISNTLLFYCYSTLVWQTSDGGIIKRLYNSNLKEMEIYFPKCHKEQQKIADCLSSLDEVITAEREKLTVLKDHKKGLLQQLFPAKGETTPKYRFPEFENDGDWEAVTIQKLIDDKTIISHLDGNHGALYPKSEEFSNQGVPYISANDFINGIVDFKNCKRIPIERAKKFKKGVAKNGDILFAHNATVGPVARLETELDFVILSTTATYFRCDNMNLCNNYLLQYLITPNFIAQYTRVMSQSTRNQVPITTQRKFHLSLPKKIKEQQKIANCLSSMDDLIEEQVKKIEGLKNHKKGLMQQLFPDTNKL
ncbi:restriction endonuclease subunit S [Flavicella sediminum]|uniref:restriction endonuclease subunit S n=1 Tax=Flavicella sediminum TaxID=2585141 RepID=UPI001123C259|nr:restriction endonuclease subunit S [Flavicella sediminum]